MLDLICKYRNAPERKHLVLGIKAFAGIDSRIKQNPALKNALMELKTVKAGVMACRKELDLLLCDVMMVAAVLSACIIIKCKISKCKKEEKE